MYILGVNAYHGDASACIIKDGVLIAALEEERIRRVKHWAGFPSEAIKFCLNYAGITLKDIDHIAISRDPNAHLFQKIGYALRARPSIKSLIDRLMNRKKVSSIEAEFEQAFGERPRATIHNVEHHHAHIASAFLVSPFEESAVLSVDGMGDFVSTMWGKGKGNHFEVLGEVNYPHSLGFFYTALTQYLGFWKYGDEYKIMGLSAMGKPIYEGALMRLIHLHADDPGFELNLDYFVHHKTGVQMSWNGGEPVIGKMFSDKLTELLGPAREKNVPLEKRHEDLAASVQAVYEKVFFHMLEKLTKQTGSVTLSFAGGTAQNSLANGKIFTRSSFKDVYIPPAGYDAGTAVGAAYYVYHETLGNPRTFVMESPFWGPDYTDEELEGALKFAGLQYEKLGDEVLFDRVADHLERGEIVGWFQGRTEWGPRALGNRSILANPTRPDMKDVLNLKIKKREAFRPFAPSVLEEVVPEYFSAPGGSPPERTSVRAGSFGGKVPLPSVPFMEKVYAIKKEKQSVLPAVTHADGTGRLQSVSRKINPRYWGLINAFGKKSGVPIVLNTSFNENEPIVNKPEEAIDCFLRTKMDILVLGNYFIKRI